MSLWQNCNTTVRENIALAPFTTWGIGGKARWFAEPQTVSELAALIAEAELNDVRLYVLGGGSNLLVSDGVLDGLVICLSSYEFKKVEVDDYHCQIIAGSGAPFTKVINLAKEKGFSGLEYFAGIPGTIGGAALMNAGTKGHAIGLRIKEVGVVDMAGRFGIYNRNNLFFTYRQSNLNDLVITSVKLDVRKDLPELIESRCASLIQKKSETQPLDQKSAGCVFKNPVKNSAGLLIDKAGCKGWREGDAVVSEVHANFIVNDGKATYADTMKLIERVQKQVYLKFNIMLELEIKIWI